MHRYILKVSWLPFHWLVGHVKSKKIAKILLTILEISLVQKLLLALTLILWRLSNYHGARIQPCRPNVLLSLFYSARIYQNIA